MRRPTPSTKPTSPSTAREPVGLACPGGFRRSRLSRRPGPLGRGRSGRPPGRLARLRARMAAAGVDAYLGVRPENTRYLTGLVLGDGEEKVAGVSGWFLVSPAEVVVFADSRYTVQAASRGDRGPDRAGLRRPGGTLARDAGPARPGAGGSNPVRTVAVEAGYVSHATWAELAAAAPEVELVAASTPPGPAVAGGLPRSAGSRPIGRSRSRPSSNASRRRAPRPTGPWPPSCPRSGRASPRRSSPGGSRS